MSLEFKEKGGNTIPNKWVLTSAAERLGVSLSLTGRTAGVFKGFPLNSTGGEVDKWRGLVMGLEETVRLMAACVTLSKL